MNLVETSEKAHDIAEKIRQIMLEKIYSREPPNKIWLTDTVYCGRKKIFRILGLGEAIPERAIARIWLGIVVGEYLRGLGMASEVKVEYRGITGRIDVLTDTNEPVEIKTVNKYVLASNLHTSHIEQLSRYALAVGKTTGVLFHYIVGEDLTNMPSVRYKFRMDKVMQETDERIEILEKALQAEDPFILPPTWHSQTFNNWECRQCNFRPLCMAGQKAYLI